MDVPKVTYNADGPVLRAVFERGFDLCFVKGTAKCFAELIAVEVLYHCQDNTQPGMRHFLEWMAYLCAVTDMQNNYRRSKEIAMWRELKDRVLSFMREKIPTKIGSEGVLAGVVPDRANTDVMETIAAALRAVIVWYEVVEEQIVTRYFYRGEPGTWFFYLYFASENNCIIALQHPSMLNHAPDSPTSSCSLSPPHPIIVGLLDHQEIPQADCSAQVFNLLLRVARQAERDNLQGTLKTSVEGHLGLWRVVEEQVHRSQLEGVVNCGEVKECLERLVRPEPKPARSSLGVPASAPHHISSCAEHPSFPSAYIKHTSSHSFHVTCLAEYFQVMIRNNPPDTPIKCMKCPLPFSEEMILTVLPHYRTMKREATKEWQERTTTKL